MFFRCGGLLPHLSTRATHRTYNYSMVAPPRIHHAVDDNTGEEEEEWQLLGDVPFRKWACYPAPLPCWDSLALEDHIVVGAANGGPLAVLRNEKRQVMMTGAERLAGFLRIYSSAGVLLGQAPWELGRKVVSMGWTEAEALVIISETGHVYWYTLLGQKMEQGGGSSGSGSSSGSSRGGGQGARGGEGITRLFAEGSPRRVIQAQVWLNGYVALADDYTLHIYDGSRANPEGRLYRLPASGLSGQRSPTSLALLQPPLGGEEEGGNGGASSNSSGDVLQILLGTSDNSLLVVDGARGTSEVYNLQSTLPGPVVKMSVSPDSRFVGCFAEGLLTVYATSNYSKVLDPFDAGTSQVPAAMGWCGKDALILYWKVMGLLVVGPYGDFLHFPYAGEPLVLIPEVDCCRLWTGGREGKCEVLQRVPAATESIHRIGSTEPAAMLYDAMEAFEKGDPKADENIRSILASSSSSKTSAVAGEGSSSSSSSFPSSSSSFASGSGGGEKSQLHGAIQACLRAALAAWDAQRQKKYLHAASYGKSFYDDEEQQQSGREGRGEEGEPNEFVDVCRKLRVLNHLRRSDVGIPLTAGQLGNGGREGGWGALIDRLLLRRQYFLALKVCDYMSCTREKEKVLVQWACAYLQSRHAIVCTDKELRDEIRRKVNSAFLTPSSPRSSHPPYLSYAAIARTADQVGRRGLATMLLTFEPSPSSQVDLLLEMGEFNLALHQSLLSNDLDLAYRALLYVEAHKPSQETFLRLLSLHPMSLQLLKVYYRSRMTREERTPWFNVSLARGDLMEAGTILAFQAYAQESLPRRIELIKEAARLYSHHGKRPLSSSSPSSFPASSSSSSIATATAAAATAALAASAASASFYHRATEEQAELLEVQSALEKRTGKNENVFVGLSVSETIYNLIVLASDSLPPSLTPSLLLAEASRVAKKFKVPEKRFWHLKINALAASGQFENLKSFSNEKKSPVGYKPFAQACIKHKQPSGVVEGYIDRVALQEDRFDLYVEVRLWQKAAETAYRLKDPLRLRQVQANCLMPGLQRSVEELLAKLG